MTDIKKRIQEHFYTRKGHFILGKPVLTIFQGNDRFDITPDYKDGQPWFKVDHGTVQIYFTDPFHLSEFIEKHKD